ncbi:50S ribosomal protein L18e [Candidatus Pacearchaeota archaeon CG10_big_fil_rev_8_21_14_0_10_35_13]|nr:MAG: 50S ribosomal protein L18e [Candidatus Pacearchaeota archaeon CG10_big_fil_rev_8_21_14_0_10_35_13]
MTGITKTIIKRRARNKTNPELVETLRNAKNHEEWMNVARVLARPTKKINGVNLETIEEETKEGDTIVIPGKVLGTGEITKKIRIVAMNFSKTAIEKLSKTKSEMVTINEEIAKNPKAKGIKIIIGK